MFFVCKIVKDCVHSDGIRDYQFKLPITRELLDILDQDFNTKVSVKKLGKFEYYRFDNKDFKLFGNLGKEFLTVEFKDHHPPEIRDLLEDCFTKW